MSEWIHSTVGAVTQYQTAGGTPTATNDIYYGGDIPFVTIEDITRGTRFLDRTEKNLSAKGLQNSASWLIKDKHVLYSMYATVGKPIVNRITCATNQAIIALKEKDVIEQMFLFYQLLFMRPDVYKYTSQTTQSNLNAGSVRKLPISYPKNKSKQKKIVAILTATDEAIETTEALIEKYQQIKAGLMHDLFTRGIGADGKMRPPREQAPELYQETAIGWIPKEWNALRLKFILAKSGGYLQTGPFGSQLHSHEYVNEGIPVVMPQDVNDGLIDEVQIARITELRAQSLLKHRLKVGDIIIARRGDLSRAAAAHESNRGWVCGTGCFLLRLAGTSLDARFYALTYTHPIIQRQVEGLAVGSTMPSLNNEIMGKLIFPSLTKKEQSAIADKVELSDVKINSMYAQLAKLQKQKSGLMQDLLTGKVEVSITSVEAAHV